ncbi:alpha/beta-hydrolase [Thozetella sp. PMI_491]|nr:alpha/beta-hydrolase [Thozetella sp. PMI_491]
MLSVEDTRALSIMDSELAEAIKEHPQVFRAMDLQTDIFQVRSILSTVSDMKKASKPTPEALGCREEDIQVPLRDGASIIARVHKPLASPEGGAPGMVVFHGGGFIFGDLETEAWLCHIFTSLGGVAVDIDYRLAPEHPFPGPVYDCLDGLKWVAENAGLLGIDAEKGLLVLGESAGADIALAVAHLYQDEKTSAWPALTGIYAAGNSAMSEHTLPEKYRDHWISWKQNAKAPMWTVESMALVREHYKPDLANPLAAPILYNHAGIPKTYFQAFGLDPLRDCTLIMEQVWKDSGIQTKLDIYPGLCHAFYMELPGVDVQSKSYWKRHQRDSLNGLKWLLSK